MKLNKKNCETRIRLTPCDGDFLRVHFRIGGDNHYFYPSCVMGDQFSSFLKAVFCLYEEKENRHLFLRRWIKDFHHEYPHDNDENMHIIINDVYWDEEGSYIHIKLTRKCFTDAPLPVGVSDPVDIEIDCRRGKYHYTIDGRELCYAVAKACTEAIKKYGFQGYLCSTGMQYLGDYFEMDELLFVKAYALDAMEVRKLEEAYSTPSGICRADASSFEKELELLLFDM